MDITIRYIKVGELDAYIRSDEFKKGAFEPISRNRAASYTANPNADKEDIALLLAYINNTLVGYLGLLSDKIDCLQQKIKFCWISCMWILPDYRRGGIALKLLKEAYSVTNGLIMITNYIPRSKAAFLKTGHYKELELLTGYRFYIKSDLKNILHRKYQNTKYFLWFLASIDLTFNLFLSALQAFSSKKNKIKNTYQFIDRIDIETSDFINNFAEKSLFQRSSEEFSWIMNYPWVSNKKDCSIDYSKYHFSQYVADFRQWFVKIKNERNLVIGFLMLTRHKNELKIPYYFCTENNDHDLASFMMDFIKLNHIRTTITYNSQIAKAIINKGTYFMKRKSNYGFLASSRIYEMLQI